MGSRRGPEQTIGQNFTMKLLLALCLLGLAAGSEDYKMFMKWAKTKAMESCWGEDNMKIHTVNMKKAVAKCNQQDAPELDLPPFRAINRMINNLVGMASYKEDQHGEIEDFKQFLQYYEIAKMMNKDHESHGNYQRDTYQPYSQNYKEVDGDMGMEKMKMMMMMMNMMTCLQCSEVDIKKIRWKICLQCSDFSLKIRWTNTSSHKMTTLQWNQCSEAWAR